MEQTLDDKAEADMKAQEFRCRLHSELGYTKEEVETILNRKPAVIGGEKKEEKKEEWKETREKYQFKQQTEGEDAEGIIDALLARYTM